MKNLENAEMVSKEIELSEKIEMIVKSEELNKSTKIKQLFLLDQKIADIAKMLNIRYNFAYNVIQNFAITEGIEIIQKKEKSKKDEIIELFKENKSSKEIAISLKSNLNYIYKIIKEYKELEELEKCKEIDKSEK